MTATTLAPAWPDELTEVFTSSLVSEYATLTRQGRPVTWPVTPYLGHRTLDVSTGLTYPLKAERARANPRVALSYSNPAGYASGSASARPPVVLVEGLATVRDADLQANTDRYVRESVAKTGTSGTPWFLARTWAWYYARIWVEVTPVRVTWWPEADLSVEPRVWTAPTDVAAPASDPPPAPRTGATAHTGSGGPAPADWRPFADRAEQLGAPVVTMTRAGGPLPVRARTVRRIEGGYVVSLPLGVSPTAGPVCLTFHRVGAGPHFSQENVVLLGEGRPDGDDQLTVVISRAVNDWSVWGSQLARVRDWFGHGARLKAHLAEEAARRGQPVPRVRRTP
jgi:hypothetical protein